MNLLYILAAFAVIALVRVAGYAYVDATCRSRVFPDAPVSAECVRAIVYIDLIVYALIAAALVASVVALKTWYDMRQLYGK